jgi:hypothetical protein
MQCAVALHEVCPFKSGELAERVSEGLGGKVGVEPRQSIAQALFENHLAVVLPLGEEFTGRDLGAMPHLPAKGFEPGEGSGFDGGFGHNAHASSGSAPRAKGFSRSKAHCRGLFRMYSRVRFNDSSLRMMCSK